MAQSRVEAVADLFWSAAGGREGFGHVADVERAASRALPVAVRSHPALHTGDVSNLLARIGAPRWGDGSPRALRGCLVADVGKALILVDGDDPEDERRMTVAHEVAHLLIHYLAPRAAAVTAFGDQILAVLDRTRPATVGERFSAAIRDLPIEPYRHAMDRTPSGRKAVGTMEDEADDLAVELLAPWRKLQSMRGAAPGLLRERFGLPASVAARLSALIAPVAVSSGVVGLFGKK